MTSNANLGGYPDVGDVIDGKYRVESLIGEGGMGAVAKATHLVRRAPVALKFMNTRVLTVPGAVERFVNEAVAASQIDSDHIVRIFDTGTLASGAPYLVMDYLEGIDLATLITREGQGGLPVARAVHLVLQVLRGLQVAHQAGVIHRDMKPANCFIVTKDGEPDFIKLLDFGISKVVQPGGAVLTQGNAALGTPLYMSPEQARSPRDVDLRSDLYSTGVILYELLTGGTPVDPDSGEVTEILYKLFTTDAPLVQSRRADLPDGLARAVHRALARDPKERVSSASEMAELLAPWADARSDAVLAKIRAHLPKPTPMPSRPPDGFGESLRIDVERAVDSHARTDVANATTEVGDGAKLASSTGARPGAPVVVQAVKPSSLARTDLGSTQDRPEARSQAPSTVRIAVGGALAAVALAVVAGAYWMRRTELTPPATTAASQAATATPTSIAPSTTTSTSTTATTTTSTAASTSASPPSSTSIAASPPTSRHPPPAASTPKPDAGTAAPPNVNFGILQ